MNETLSVISQTVLAQKAAVRKELAEFANLPVDWDYDDGHPPAAADLANASAFLDYIPPQGLLAISLTVAGDGDVAYEWKTEKLRLEVGFRRGNISFFGENRITGAEINGDYAASTIFPRELIYFMDAAFPPSSLKDKSAQTPEITS